MVLVNVPNPLLSVVLFPVMVGFGFVAQQIPRETILRDCFDVRLPPETAEVVVMEVIAVVPTITG